MGSSRGLLFGCGLTTTALGLLDFLKQLGQLLGWNLEGFFIAHYLGFHHR